MKKKHIDFLLKFHKKSRHLYALYNCGTELNRALNSQLSSIYEGDIYETN